MMMSAHGRQAIPLKYVASVNPESFIPGDPTDEIEYMDIGGVDPWGRVLTESMTLATAPSRAKRIARDGDTVISTVRTYLRAIAYVAEPPPNLVISTGFAVLRPRLTWVEPRYLYYAVQSEHFVTEVIARSTGVSYPAIAPSRLGRIKLRLAPREVQSEIVETLNRALQRTDALIEANESLAQLLLERHQAQRSAILLGKDLSNQYQLLQVGSGIRVPARWRSIRSKYLFDEIDLRSVTGEEQLLSVSYRSGVTLTAERSEAEHRLESASLVGYKKCQAGDVLLNRLMAFRGAIHVTPFSGVVSPEYLVLRPRPGIDAHYLAAIYRTPDYVAEFGRRSKGIGDRHFRLHIRDFGVIPVGLPIAEDRSRLDKLLAQSDTDYEATATARIEMARLLRERRSAVITDIVEDAA